MKEDGRVLTEITFSLHTGGSERIASALAMHFASRGVRTTLCATHGDPGPVGEQLVASGIPAESAATGPSGRLGRALRLFRHLRRAGTTVLHAHHFNMLAVAYGPARLAGVERFVVTEHSNLLMRESSAARSRAARYGTLADVVTVVHEGLAEYLTTEIGLPRRKIRVIPNGVDTTLYRVRNGRRVRSDLGVEASEVLFGSVGRLHPDKDPANLVRAFALIPESRRGRLRLLLVGDGPVRGEVERLVQENGLGARVLLLGERHDVPALLGALDFFVLPSRSEGLPVALLEAMSAGLPCVATSVGGVPAAVGGAGLLVPPRDPESLARAVLRLAEDAGLRRRLGATARERAMREFERSRMFAAYEEALFGNRSDEAAGSEERR